MVTIFETNFATFLVKNYDLKYSLMGTETKRLDEKNSIVHEKNNLRVNIDDPRGKNWKMNLLMLYECMLKGHTFLRLQKS